MKKDWIDAATFSTRKAFSIAGPNLDEYNAQKSEVFMHFVLPDRLFLLALYFATLLTIKSPEQEECLGHALHGQTAESSDPKGFGS